MFEALPEDDPKQRKPDIGKAKALLGWAPRVPLEDGLRETVAYFRESPLLLPEQAAVAETQAVARALALVDQDQGFDWIQKAYDDRSAWLVYLKAALSRFPQAAAHRQREQADSGHAPCGGLRSRLVQFPEQAVHFAVGTRGEEQRIGASESSAVAEAQRP